MWIFFNSPIYYKTALNEPTKCQIALKGKSHASLFGVMFFSSRFDFLAPELAENEKLTVRHPSATFDGFLLLHFSTFFYNIRSSVCVSANSHWILRSIFALAPNNECVESSPTFFFVRSGCFVCAICKFIVRMVHIVKRRRYGIRLTGWKESFQCWRWLFLLSSFVVATFFSFTNLKLDSDFIRFMAKWLGHKTKVIKNEKKRDNPKHLRFCQFLWTLVGPHVTIGNGMRVCVRERIVNSFWYARNFIRTK